MMVFLHEYALCVDWTCKVFVCVQHDKGFDYSTFERQMSVMRGQVSVSRLLNILTFILLLPGEDR